MHFFRRHRKSLIAATVITGIFGAGYGIANAHFRHGPPIDRIVGQLDTLRGELRLNVNQEVLWKQAMAQTRMVVAQAFDQHGQMREAFRAALDTPGVDLRQLTEKADRMFADADTTRKQVRDLWLGVYDSLDAAQRDQVRVFMKERAARFQRFRDYARHWRDDTSGPGAI